MSARLKPHKVKGRQLEEVREKDPDGRIVYHHRTVDTLGKMLKAGTISPEFRCCVVMRTPCLASVIILTQ